MKRYVFLLFVTIMLLGNLLQVTALDPGTIIGMTIECLGKERQELRNLRNGYIFHEQGNSFLEYLQPEFSKMNGKVHHVSYVRTNANQQIISGVKSLWDLWFMVNTEWKIIEMSEKFNRKVYYNGKYWIAIPKEDFFSEGEWIFFCVVFDYEPFR